jgi:hypothetical protein
MLGRVSLSATCGGELRVIQCDGTTLCRDWMEEGIGQTAEETPMTSGCSSDGDNSTIRQFDAKGAWWWRPETTWDVGNSGRKDGEELF